MTVDATRIATLYAQGRSWREIVAENVGSLALQHGKQRDAAPDVEPNVVLVD